MIQNLLNDKIKNLGLSNREAARQIGIAHTTLNRILEGGDFDLSTLVQISTWLQVNPATLLGTLAPSEDALASQITVLLQSSPDLARVFSEAMSRVLSERMSADVFKELIAYATFRMEQATRSSTIVNHQQSGVEVEEPIRAEGDL